MAEKKVTIKDVAREAGVSISTVSRFLNDNFSSMSKETKDRIQEVIERLQYHPNKLAQGLKGQSRTIAVVVVNMGYPFCVAVIRSISDVLNACGYSLVVCETRGDAKQELTLLHSLVAQGVDGIILQTSGSNNELLQSLAATMPIVLVDRHFDMQDVKNVITNNLQASFQLTDALFQEGYERVYFVSEEVDGLSTRQERYNGYLQACSKHQREPYICWVDRDNPASMEAVPEVLRRYEGDLPFAVYTSNGLLMLELYPLLIGLSKQIPEEMGIATFDEPAWVKITQPNLTCVRQPTHEIGQLAANLVLDRLRGDIKPHLQSPVQIVPSELVWSASTKRKKM